MAPAAAGAADDRELAGEVIDARARWTADGRRIVTEAVLRTDEGEEVSVRQPGGTVGGVGMVVVHGPPLLRAGDRATVVARPARDLRGRTSLAVRRVTHLEADDRLRFVRTVNGSGAPLYWSSSCVYVTYDAAGTSHLPGDREFEIMDQVLERWRQDTQSCSYLTFEREGRHPVEVGFDGVNVVKYRDDRWCRPATDDEPEECYDPNAAGLTTLFYVDDADSARNGQLYDADIELNGVHFALSDDGDTDGSADCLADIANTFTHEVGHLVGLDHTCHAGGGEPPLDGDGEPAPSCSEPLSAEILDATMFTYQECGETKKATPEDDDIAGVCAIYSLDDEAPMCQRPDLSTGCCSAGGAGPDFGSLPLPVLLLLGAAWLTGLARKRAGRGARGSARR